MTHTHHVTEGDVWAAVIEAGKAIYLAEESTAKALADGSKQQVNVSQNFVKVAGHEIEKAIQSFNTYEAAKRAMEHSSFWGSMFGWVLTIVAVVASAFAGPEMLLITVAFIIASKTGLTNKLETALGNAIGSKLAASLILTAVVCAAGGAAGAGAGALSEEVGSVVAEDAASSAVGEAAGSAAGTAGKAVTEEDSTVLSKIKAAGKAVTKKIGSLSRTTAGALNGFGQGLQNFNVGSEVAKEMAKLHAKWATDLGITLEVLITLVGAVAQGAGTGNGMMRASAAGKGLCGSSMMVNNVGLFKAAGTMGTVAGLGEGACGIATGVMEKKEAHAIHLYTQSQALSQFFDEMKEFSHAGFSSWTNTYSSLEKTLAKQAVEVGNSLSTVNTQLAIAMSGRG